MGELPNIVKKKKKKTGDILVAFIFLWNELFCAEKQNLISQLESLGKK